MGKERTIFSVIQMISIEERWRDYIEELYAKDKKPIHIILEQQEKVVIDTMSPRVLRK